MGFCERNDKSLDLMQYGVKVCSTDIPSEAGMGVKLGISHHARKTG